MIDDKGYLIKANLYDGLDCDDDIIFYQNDTRQSKIVAEFTGKKRAAIDVADCTVVCVIQKSDKEIVTAYMENDFNVANRAEYVLSQNALASTGKGIITIFVYGSDNERQTFGSIKFKVLKDVNSGSVESTTEYPVLTKLISDAKVATNGAESAKNEILGISADIANAEKQRNIAETKREESESNRSKEFTGIKKEYESLKGIMIDENNAANLQNQINEANSQLDNKASKVDLKVQTARIDNIVAVQDSTDNLETADIRIGLDGEKYGSAGEAVRGQNKRIYEEIDNKFTPINLLYNPVKTINDADMVRYANDGQPNAIHIDAGSLILHFYKIQPSTEYYFNTIGTGLAKIAFFESLDTTSGICYFTKFVSNWNTKITSPENANYIVVSYNPSLKDTMYFGTESDFLLFSKYKKNQVLKDNILVKDLNERIELLERKKHVTIGLNGDFKTIKEGFKYAFENDLTAIIEPGVYDLVSEGISGIGYVAPKEVYGYGATLLCNLEEENWLLSPINISPNSKGSKIYGLTIICSNCRYCIHDDMGGQLFETPIPFYHNVYKDLLLIHNSDITSVLKAPQCIGGGFGDYGYIEIDNCVFDSKIYADVSYHSKSWNPQTPQTNDCVLICKDSVFKSTFSISAIGDDTSYMNKVYISNCLMKSLPDVRDRTNIKFISWNNVKSA